MLQLLQSEVARIQPEEARPPSRAPGHDAIRLDAPDRLLDPVQRDLEDARQLPAGNSPRPYSRSAGLVVVRLVPKDCASIHAVAGVIPRFP